MDKHYDHTLHEKRIYKMWEEGGYFKPSMDPKAKTFSVLMPPPNANAPLHCGHATYAIQDVMARFKRMQGYNTAYFPGTDHAGFETQVVYERNLKKEGKSRFDFDRKTLYENIYKFVVENSDTAINQLKRLGMSADWERNTFMLDPHVIETVYDTFEKMHEEGLVYKDYYMVNYSPHHGTTFSNLETEHKETVSPLYFVKYKLKDSEETITVATVRPETIYADVAIAVNPKDKRFKDFVGKTAINPLNGREMEIIADEYVDMEFGTGALKITPGHDFNDYEIGKKHGLETISLLDLEGKMNENAPEVQGMRVFSAREKTIEILIEKGALEKVDEKYTNNLLVDYKDGKPIEPMLLPNWFVKMDGLAEKGLDAVKKDKVKFNKATWKKQMIDWLTNIRDWPISRQTVFGIRIPVWYNVEGHESRTWLSFVDKKGIQHIGSIYQYTRDMQFTFEEIKDGLQQLRITSFEASENNIPYVVSRDEPKKTGKWIQETDTFDTWFSSSQWPLTTTHYPDGKDFKTFYPTSFMDSMWDILFFWIARMIMMGMYLTGEIPFENVYIHGRINDEQGRKMSKSLGNVINPIEFIDKYGADALRMGILVGGNTAAKSTSLSEAQVKGYRNFSNKIWNMARFMNMMIEEYGKEVPTYNSSMEKKLKADDKKIIKNLNTLIKETTKGLEKYNFKETGDAIYHFLWHEVADIYIESIKNREDKDIAFSVLRHVYTQSLKLLHPFMPFVTEGIWSEISKDTDKPLIVSSWPKVN